MQNLVLLLLLTCFAQFAANDDETKESSGPHCTAGTFTEGDTAKIICHFGLITKHVHGFVVKHRNDLRDEIMLLCIFNKDNDELECPEKSDDVHFDEKVSDTITLEIRNARPRHSGNYTCELQWSSDADGHQWPIHCTLDITANGQITSQVTAMCNACPDGVEFLAVFLALLTAVSLLATGIVAVIDCISNTDTKGWRGPGWPCRCCRVVTFIIVTIVSAAGFLVLLFLCLLQCEDRITDQK